MQSKSIFGALAGVAAGMIVCAPMAMGQTNVVSCINPTLGLTSAATIGSGCSEGLDSTTATGCLAPGTPEGDGLPVGTPAVTTIKLTATIDGCATNAAKITQWAASSGSKAHGIKAGADVKLNDITSATISIKAKTYGTCNFSVPAADAYSANGKGSVKWLDSTGKGVAKSAFYGTIAGDLGTYSATDDGIVTKGFGVGAEIHASVGFDLAAPGNGPILGCNTGSPPPFPVPAIFFTTDPPGTTTISVDFN